MAFTKHKSLGFTCMPQNCTDFNECIARHWNYNVLEIFTWHVPWEQQKLICIHKKRKANYLHLSAVKHVFLVWLLVFISFCLSRSA